VIAQATDAEIVITGTSRGIGLHLAHAFLDRGARVCGINRRTAAIRHNRYRELIADLSDRASVRTLLPALRNANVRGVINNAGIHGVIGPFAENDLNEWFRTFEVNLFSAAAITQACIPSLRRAQGFVIFISGGGSAFPRPNFSAYAVSKTGVVRFSENLAKELAPEVLVYCMAPGPNRTDLLDEAIQKGEPVPPEDIVGFEQPERLCIFLAENRNPNYSGRFFHVKDPYATLTEAQLVGDAYTLRRIKPVMTK
jgi:NAD(P)-dependent dehydrogenase (short-subunit alcohol dehydrogenase family)